MIIIPDQVVKNFWKIVGFFKVRLKIKKKKLIKNI